MQMPSSALTPSQLASLPHPDGRARLRRESSAEQVAAHIRRAIMAGDLPPGERLRQDDIADELGVSRIPVREAIIALDREGWLRLAANRGAYVAALGVHDVRDHYELRGLIFGLVARRAAAAATADDIDVLAERHGEMGNAPDLATFAYLNDRFLGTLVRTAGSPRLTAALLVTPSIIPRGFFDVVAGAREIQQKGLAPLLRAVRTHAEGDADDAMRSLLRRHGDAVVAAFSASGLLSATPPAQPVGPDAPAAVGEAETRAEAVARYVRRLVFDGRLRPGQRLPQDEIARRVGVSRIPVREAIIVLEREGWLRTEPHRGTFVNAFDERAITDRFALHSRFFGFAARRAIDRMTPTDLDELTTLAARLDRVISPAGVARANDAYLTRLVELAASSRLQTVLRSIAQVVPGNFFAAVPASIAVQKRGVAAVHAAIVAGDGEAADRAWDAIADEHAAEVVTMIAERERHG
jgi:DNA-binding GntR family transcriptional regulator